MRWFTHTVRFPDVRDQRHGYGAREIQIDLGGRFLPADVTPPLARPTLHCALDANIQMQIWIGLAGFAFCKIDPSPFSAIFAPRSSSIALAGAPREVIPQLFEWFRERLSEIHVSALSV